MLRACTGTVAWSECGKGGGGSEQGGAEGAERWHPGEKTARARQLCGNVVINQQMSSQGAIDDGRADGADGATGGRGLTGRTDTSAR